MLKLGNRTLYFHPITSIYWLNYVKLIYLCTELVPFEKENVRIATRDSFSSGNKNKKWYPWKHLIHDKWYNVNICCIFYYYFIILFFHNFVPVASTEQSGTVIEDSLLLAEQREYHSDQRNKTNAALGIQHTLINLHSKIILLNLFLTFFKKLILILLVIILIFWMVLYYSITQIQNNIICIK